jgi:predicted flavoprotein YhiN
MIGLLREATANHLPADAGEMASLVKQAIVRVVDTMPIERAISTAGGVSFSELDESLMLLRRPGTFVAGEMLDWEAPTGGYLLQACFSTGVSAARGALAWLDE